MRRAIVLGLLAVILAGVAFGAGVLVDRTLLSAGPSAAITPTPQDPASVNQSPYPSKEEVLAYLDSRTIDIPGAEKSGKPLTLKKEQIIALEVARVNFSSGGGPNDTPVSFIVTTDQGRFAVDGSVAHRKVDSERAFYGFQVSRVSKQ